MWQDTATWVLPPPPGIATPATCAAANPRQPLPAVSVRARTAVCLLLLPAVGALSVVTLGVAYLSYTSWNDSRLEAEDRRRVESFRPSARWVLGAGCWVEVGAGCWELPSASVIDVAAWLAWPGHIPCSSERAQ